MIIQRIKCMKCTKLEVRLKSSHHQNNCAVPQAANHVSDSPLDLYFVWTYLS